MYVVLTTNFNYFFCSGNIQSVKNCTELRLKYFSEPERILNSKMPDTFLSFLFFSYTLSVACTNIGMYCIS